jgi:hypothetical protein
MLGLFFLKDYKNYVIVIIPTAPFILSDILGWMINYISIVVVTMYTEHQDFWVIMVY